MGNFPRGAGFPGDNFSVGRQVLRQISRQTLHVRGTGISCYDLKTGKKLNKTNRFFQLKVRSNIKPKTNMNYFVYEGGQTHPQRSLFTLKSDFLSQFFKQDWSNRSHCIKTLT